MIEVYLDDGDGVNFLDAANWAKANCVGFCGVRISDISDISYVADELAVYKFSNSADAAWFTMQWKGKNYGV